MENEARTIEGFLIVRATGEMRVTTRRVRPRMDEVAFPLTVTIPDTWGRIQSTSIELTMPEPPEATVEMNDPE